jgi:putative transposase
MVIWPALVGEELADQLGEAQTDGVELLGPDDLLSHVTKAVLERALVEEMTGQLGYEEQDPAGRGSGNSRNGATPKSVLADVGLRPWEPRRTTIAADNAGKILVAG